MIPIGCQVYLRRVEQNLTQEELARKAGIPQPNLSNIEKGKQDITISTLRKIAVAFNVDPGEFFGDLNAPKSSLSRAQIERLARKVADETQSLKDKKNEVITLYKNILPHKGRVRMKELRRSWLELRKRFNSQEINSVYERAEEYGRRKL